VALAEKDLLELRPIVRLSSSRRPFYTLALLLKKYKAAVYATALSAEIH